MSVPGQRRSVFVVVTLGMLGAGCEAPADPEEYSQQQTPLTNASANWTVKGIVRGTSQHDELLDVKVLTSVRGTVFVAGYEDGRDGLAPIDPSGSSTDGTLIKYYFDPNKTDTAPERVRASYLGRGNNANDVIEALAVEPSSSPRVFFTGRTTGQFNKPNQGQFDTIVGWWKNDANNPFPAGNVFQFGDNRPQHPRRLSVSSEQIVVGGYNDYTVSGGAVEAWEDPYLLKLKLTREGTLPKSVEVAAPPNWQAPVFTASYTDTALGMCVDPNDDSTYLAGNNSGGLNRGMFVNKYSASGALLWSKRPSSIAMDMVAAVVKHPTAEGTVFAGSTYAALGTSSGDQDVVIRHLKDNGDTGWTYQYGSPGPDWVTDMVMDSAGNVYVVGETLDTLDPSLPSQGGYDLFVIKLYPNPSTPPESWKREVFQMGSAGDDHPSAIAVDAATQKIYVVGYTTGDLGLPRDNPGKSTDYLEPAGNFGGRDGFLLQLTPPQPTGGDVGTSSK